MQEERMPPLSLWLCFCVFLTTALALETNMTWDRYYSLEDIENYMESLAEEYKFISTIDLGPTYEGRSIKVLRLGWGSKRNASVLIVGGIHANEHIGPAATTFLLNHILETKINRTVWDFEGVNYYFIPVANPDGYKYSFETERTWRKNREPFLLKNNKTVYGVDLNRNWKTGWKRHKKPWLPNYSGPEPFSAAETRALANFIQNITNLNTFVSIHNFGQYIIYPWTHVTAPIRDYKHIRRVAENMASAIKKQGGPMYNVGSGARKLAIVPGTPENWVRRMADVKYVFSLILRDQGDYGYDVPPEIIPIVAGDAVAAITSLIKQMKRLRKIQSIR